MIKNRFFLIPLLLLSTLYVLASAEDLSSQTLQNDLQYYEKIAAKQELNANDRYYILLRIENKYRGTSVDLAPLTKEMQSLQQSATTEKPAPATDTMPDTSKKEKKIGTVDSISVQQTDTESRINIKASNVGKMSHFLLNDPNPKKPPKLVLDIYNVEDALPAAEKNIKVKNGIFANIKAGQFDDENDKIVRVIADMRSKRSYKVKREKDGVTIIAEKEGAEIIKPAKEKTVTPKPVVATQPVLTSANKKTTLDMETYQIDSGDIIAVTVRPAEELSRQIVVQADGNILFPLIGTTKAKGYTTAELEKVITRELGKYVSNPKIVISIQKFSKRQIFVTGQVRAVGAFDYKDDLRLMEFISSRGGFAADANRSSIKVYRGPPTDRQTIIVDVEDLIRTGDFSKDFLLEPGDIIEVPKGERKVSVLGDVNTPGYIELTENMKLTELISRVGGFKDTAKISKITILRIEEGKKGKNVIKVNLKKILKGQENDVPIMIGDTVFIPQQVITKADWFFKTVMTWGSFILMIVAINAST